MPFALYEKLVRGLEDPRRLVLNYSGESTLYPDIVEAIRLARDQGALVELVSAVANVPDGLLRSLAWSGLGRLTVSVHAVDPVQFLEIYRHSSAETLVAKLRAFVAFCGETPAAPAIDIGFVAMRRNLGQILHVGRLAAELGILAVGVFPVMRRDEIDVSFPELEGPAQPSEEFRIALRDAVQAATSDFPAVRFTYSNPSITAESRTLGAVPQPYPWPLPEGGRVHTCEQNPFETAHVLASGDVVVCEVLDHIPLGNLHEQSISEIWGGSPYQQFRNRYVAGQVPECRNCVWKHAYQPGPLDSSILAGRGANAQLIRGWHDGEPENGIVWSSQQAAAVVRARSGAVSLHVSGILPPPPQNNEVPNELQIVCGGAAIGSVRNGSQENHAFGLDFDVPPQAEETLLVEFRTRYVYRSRDRGTGSDQRDLGFALMLLSSNRRPVPNDRNLRERIVRMRHWLERADRLGRHAPAIKPRPLMHWGRGITVLIPERGNAMELGECLASVRSATWAGEPEPCDVLVVVNGTPPESYAELRREHPTVRWIFEGAPLGFNRAVQRGLREVRHDWTYLLNSDAAPMPEALGHAMRLRSNDVFAIASQIRLRDQTQFRDETNLGVLRLEDKLVTLHDRIPQDRQDIVETSYAGGGASLFRTSVLRRFVDESGVYSPFYWEDVEWGWRARKLGWRCLFCPESIVWHRRRSTVGKYYAPADVEEILDRNRLLFQLRNLLDPETTSRALDEIARLRADYASELLAFPQLWTVARQRIWNRRAPAMEENLLALGG